MLKLIFGGTIQTVLLTNMLTAVGFFGWGLVDKHYAVKEATAGLTSKIELETANAKIDEMARRAKVAEDAVEQLSIDVNSAIADAEKAREGLKNYVQTNSINPKCVVDGELFKRLRNK